MKKIIWLLVFVLAIVTVPFARVSAATTTAVFTIGSIDVVVDGQSLEMDVAPYIHNGRTFLPVRSVANAFGIPFADITYDSKAGKVTMVDGGATIKLSIGSAFLVVNDVRTIMDTVPEMNKGRMFLPVKWLAQALGFTATWDPAAKTVSLVASGTASSPVDPTPPAPPVVVSGTVPSQKVVAGTASESEDYKWSYGGQDFTWHVEIPEDLLSFSRAQTAQVNTYFQQTDGTAQQNILTSSPAQLQSMILECQSGSPDFGDFASWTTEPQNTAFVKQLATELDTEAKTSGYGYFDEAEFVLSFVGGAIPYKVTPLVQLPAMTLFDEGKCADKSILYASLLEALGYKVALLSIPDVVWNGEKVGHEAVGVAFTDQQFTQTAKFPESNPCTFYTKNGLNYYFAETTEPGWLLGETNYSEIPFVYPLN